MMGEDESNPVRHRRAGDVHQAEVAADNASSREPQAEDRDDKGLLQP